MALSSADRSACGLSPLPTQALFLHLAPQVPCCVYYYVPTMYYVPGYCTWPIGRLAPPRDADFDGEPGSFTHPLRHQPYTTTRPGIAGVQVDFTVDLLHLNCGNKREEQVVGEAAHETP